MPIFNNDRDASEAWGRTFPGASYSGQRAFRTAEDYESRGGDSDGSYDSCDDCLISIICCPCIAVYNCLASACEYIFCCKCCRDDDEYTDHRTHNDYSQYTTADAYPNPLTHNPQQIAGNGYYPSAPQPMYPMGTMHTTQLQQPYAPPQQQMHSMGACDLYSGGEMV